MSRKSSRKSTGTILVPSLDADVATMIQWSLNSSRVTADFTDRLGLPVKETAKTSKGRPVPEDQEASRPVEETAKSSRGRPVFEGNKAAQCTALYNLTQKAVDKVVDDHPTVRQLESAAYQQDALSVSNVVPLLLTEHGPDIWHRFDYSTRIHPLKYPRHLGYWEQNDRERLVGDPHSVAPGLT
jgi:hypothetical protein